MKLWPWKKRPLAAPYDVLADAREVVRQAEPVSYGHLFKHVAATSTEITGNTAIFTAIPSDYWYRSENNPWTRGPSEPE